MSLPVIADRQQEMEREESEVRLLLWCRGTDCRGRAKGTDCRGRAEGTDCRGRAGGTDCRGRAGALTTEVELGH